MAADAPNGDALSVDVRDDGLLRVVTLRGSASTEQSEELEQRLHELSDWQGTLALDLSELTFINSGGLGAIVAAHRRCRERSGALCVINPRPAVAQVLRITHLDRLIATYPDTDSALKALAPSPE